MVHHKPSWQYGYGYERELQAVATARLVEEQLAGRDLHVVLAGDFDDRPDSASFRFWTGRQSLDGTSVCYQDAWETARPGEAGHTFTPRNPLVTAGEIPLERGRRIDYVMVRCGVHGPTLEVAGCALAFDRPVGASGPATISGSWPTCGSRRRSAEEGPGRGREPLGLQLGRVPRWRMAARAW